MSTVRNIWSDDGTQELESINKVAYMKINHLSINFKQYVIHKQNFILVSKNVLM